MENRTETEPWNPKHPTKFQNRNQNPNLKIKSYKLEPVVSYLKIKYNKNILPKSLVKQLKYASFLFDFFCICYDLEII